MEIMTSICIGIFLLNLTQLKKDKLLYFKIPLFSTTNRIIIFLQNKESTITTFILNIYFYFCIITATF